MNAGSEVTGDPQPGDVVIMQVQANKWNHAGVLLEGNMMFHHLYGGSAGVCLMVATGWRER
jgi:cell wall-associated NlpC family hydrolase